MVSQVRYSILVNGPYFQRSRTRGERERPRAPIPELNDLPLEVSPDYMERLQDRDVTVKSAASQSTHG